MKNRMRSDRNSGFSMVEMLAAVAILVILLAVSAVAVVDYVDKLKIAELDNAAREIYMAAENRAVLLSNVRRLDSLVEEARLPVTVSTLADTSDDDLDEDDSPSEGLRGVPVSSGNITPSEESLLTKGGIDATLWNGYFYIVYDLKNGSVTDVFYAEEDMSGLVGSDFAAFYTNWAVSRSIRLNKEHKEQMLIGWYSGEAAAEDQKISPPNLGKPTVKVEIENREELTLKVKVGTTINGTSISPGVIKLDVQLGPVGIGTANSIPLTVSGPANEMGYYVYSCVLDSLRTEEPKFQTLIQRYDSEVTGLLHPSFVAGDNFKVTATVTSRDGSFGKATGSAVNNSLFQEGSGGSTAYIKYLRHLQNLSADTNTNGYNSGVTDKKTKAVQMAHIWGDGNDAENLSTDHIAFYSGYNFRPINNANIVNYYGNNLDIRNLNVHYTAGPAGLFGSESPAGMKLRSIHMVNTTVDASGQSAGALAGEVTGAVISDCRVYWDRNVFEPPVDEYSLRAKLGSDETTYNYKLIGGTVGGLVGVTKGNTTIKKSLAATLIRGSAHAGGLLGQAAGGSVSISHSYADCYLTGDNAAGLIGDLNTSDTQANFKNCYAAGFIVNAAEDTAGLCLGAGTTKAANVYSVMVCPGTDTNTPPAVNTASNLDSASANVRFLGDGTSISGSFSMGGFKGKNKSSDSVNDNEKTYPYYLQKYLWENTQKPVAYEYPGLDGLPHYGDWGSLPPASPVNLVYYEDYGTSGTDRWGVSGANHYSSNMKTSDGDGKTIVKDGYAVAFSETIASSGEITVKLLDRNSGSKADQKVVNVETLNAEGQYVNNFTGAGKDYLIFLPDELVVKKENTPSDKYNYEYLRIELYQNDVLLGEGEYYFNPHFPMTVESDEPAVELKSFDIRTPRHLYHLSQSELLYYNRGYTFNQKFDLDYETYTGYDFLTNGAVSGVQFTPQGPIGTYGSPFKGTYDGGANTVNGENHAISSLTISGGDYQGLFGSNAGAVQNVTLSKTCSVTGNSYVGGIVGYNGGMVEGCANYGDVIAKGRNAAGITGYNTSDGSTVKQCRNYGTIISYYDSKNRWDGDSGRDNEANAGGIVGSNTSKASGGGVSDCENYGRVETAKGLGAGGIVAYNVGTMQDCRNMNGAEVVGYEQAGGVVGINAWGGEVLSCENHGSVEGDGSVGGVAGVNGLGDQGSGGALYSCCNDGTVSGNQDVGGIAGHNRIGSVVQGDEKRKSINKGIIKNKDDGEGDCIGGIVGYNENTVEYYINMGTVVSKLSGGSARVGGIVGGSYGGEVSYCDNGEYGDEDAGKVEAAGQDVGGIVGHNGRFWETNEGGKLKNCNNYAVITSSYSKTDTTAFSEGANVGGIVGYSDGGSVSHCDNGATGDMTAGKVEAAGQNVGGIVGYSFNGCAVEYCRNDAKITSTFSSFVDTADARVGGIVGANRYGLVKDCENTGGEVSTSGKVVGGIVGYNKAGTVQNCDNWAKITSDRFTSDAYVSGIAGVNNSYDVETGYEGKAQVVGCENHGEVYGIGQYVGGIAGVATGRLSTVEHCVNYALIKGNYKSGSSVTPGDSTLMRLGGIVGCNEVSSTVEGCTNEGEVINVNDGAGVGGIVGTNQENGVVKNDTNLGNVTGGHQTGGIVGYNLKNSAVEGCSNNAKVTSAFTGKIENAGFDEYDAMLGGIVGCNTDSTVRYCRNEKGGTVQNNGKGDSVGGIVGYMSVGYSSENPADAIIQYCYNAAEVKYEFDSEANESSEDTEDTGDTESHIKQGRVGGILGYGVNYGYIDGEEWESSVTDCYNTGKITGRLVTGGIVGVAAAGGEYQRAFTTQNCYNTGAVVVVPEEEEETAVAVGGVVGYNGEKAVVTSCYYLTGTGNESVNGIGEDGSGEGQTEGLSVDEFASQDTFTNWDFSGIWEMGGNLTPAPTARPVLKGNGERNESVGSASTAAVESSLTAEAEATVYRYLDDFGPEAEAPDGPNKGNPDGEEPNLEPEAVEDPDKMVPEVGVSDPKKTRKRGRRDPA